MKQVFVGCARRAAWRFLAAGGLIAVAISCARSEIDNRDDASKLSSLKGSENNLALEKLSFAQWCKRWGLTCPKSADIAHETPSEFQADSKDIQQWHAISELVGKAIGSGSNFALESSELNSARIRIFMAQIGLNEVLSDINELLSKSGLKKVGLEPAGKLSFEARTGWNGNTGLAGTVRGRSGMKWSFESAGEFLVGDSGQYLFKGLRFSAASSFESDYFGVLTRNDEDKTMWSGESLAVSHVPDGFFIKDIPVRWEKFNDLNRETLITNATEARNIVFNGTRNLRLNSAFFDTAAKHMPLFVEDPKVVNAATQLANAFGTLEMKASSPTSPLAQLTLEKANAVVCRIEMTGTPALEVTLDKRFGVQNIFNNEKSAAQIDLYGINIKAKVGLPISFNLKRVDVEPTRVVVKGIPVIGEISIPLPGSDSKFGKELKKLECNER